MAMLACSRIVYGFFFISTECLWQKPQVVFSSLHSAAWRTTNRSKIRMHFKSHMYHHTGHLMTSAYPCQNKKKGKWISYIILSRHNEVRIIMELNGRALCLFYNNTTAMLKEYNTGWHYRLSTQEYPQLAGKQHSETWKIKTRMSHHRLS